MNQDYDLCGGDIDYMDFNYAIIDEKPTIGLKLTNKDIVYRGVLDEDILEVGFVVDREFFDEFITLDFGDLKHYIKLLMR